MTGTKKVVRLSKAAREFNISLDTIVSFLTEKGYDIERKPNTKLDPQMYELLTTEFQDEKQVKEIALQKGLEYVGRETISNKEPDNPVPKSELGTPVEEELIIKNTGVFYDDNKSPNTNTPKAVAPEPSISKSVDHEIDAPELHDTTVEDQNINQISEKESNHKVEEPSGDAIEKVESEKIKQEEVEEVLSVENVSPEIEADHIEEKVSTEVEHQEIITKAAPKTESLDEGIPKSEVVVEPVESKVIEPSLEDNKAEICVPDVAKESEKAGINILGTIDLESMNQKTRPVKKSKSERQKERELKVSSKSKNKRKPVAAKKNAPADKPVEKSISENVKEISDPKAKTFKTLDDIPAATKKGVQVKEVDSNAENNFIKTSIPKLSGPTVTGEKIDLAQFEKKPWTKRPPVASSSKDNKAGQNKKKRKRIKPKPQTTEGNKAQNVKGVRGGGAKKKSFVKGKHRMVKTEPTEEEIQQKIKDTLARLAPAGKSKSAKYRKRKREFVSEHMQQELQKQEEEKKIIKVTEFVTANELATMMNIGVTDVITSCMQLGLFVSINQRLDAETIVLVAEEFGYQTTFVGVDDNDNLDVDDFEDDLSDLIERAPIVTVMGHVDHGKTKLLDYIRHANVVSGEAGGITQHIGAYEVTTKVGKKITFLDTPGHEAFTAMRARGAKVTDVAIIVVAADDSVMPQTKEAINHAQAAGVPIVFAINKMDKEGANAEKVKEQLSAMDILVEDWGGKFQSQEISALTGMGVDDLLEKVLLETEMLELKANPNRLAKGTVIESTLDKGRGYVTTILVQNGTLKKGDVLTAGPVFGKVKAMFNERNQPVASAGPSVPVIVLGLVAASKAGDLFNSMNDEKDAKALASKRQRLIREQGLRTQKHLTLDEIGRRIAIGEFKELNIIVKGDVDGSIEALTDSLIKLSTDEVQVNVIHKAVGAISESDVTLASASDAIIIGFQVRPSMQARRLAEKEQIDIRLYSVIYKATEELSTAIKGMLSPKVEEKITCNIEVRETFRITKVGTIAGCYVLDGKVKRNTKVRIIRDGIVVYTGSLGSLKRFKDDAKEVVKGYECGLNIENYNDIKVGDIVEGYELVEVSI